MRNLSNDPAEKLKAVLNHAFAAPDNDPGASYRAACAAWFAALTPRERTAATAAKAAFARGDGPAAEEFARELPPAPKCPL
jgi:hypothetical protein